jgi:hypothetical protein
MSYLNDSVFELKQKIIALCVDVENGCPPVEFTEEIEMLEKLIKEKLIQSFNNGIEVGRKQRVRKK